MQAWLFPGLTRDDGTTSGMKGNHLANRRLAILPGPVGSIFDTSHGFPFITFLASGQEWGGETTVTNKLRPNLQKALERVLFARKTLL